MRSDQVSPGTSVGRYDLLILYANIFEAVIADINVLRKSGRAKLIKCSTYTPSGSCRYIIRPFVRGLLSVRQW